MAEAVTRLPIPREDDDEPGFPVLQRWIERPDGRLELLSRPLTPEDFLNPQPEDTMTQGEMHANVRRRLADLLDRHFKHALVLEDVIHQLGPGLPSPAPDVSVILGAQPGERDSFSVPKEGVSPDLIVEMDKVAAYSRAGIPEYVLVDLPRRGNRYRLGLKGYRLVSAGEYVPIEPNPKGHLLCKATGLWFCIEEDRVRVIDDRTGLPLLYSYEEEALRMATEDARQAAEDARQAAEEARKTAESENARLQEELRRLKSRLES
jgi:Uma2 family endonuclease